jgi:hypothetical protein
MKRKRMVLALVLLIFLLLPTAASANTMSRSVRAWPTSIEAWCYNPSNCQVQSPDYDETYKLYVTGGVGTFRITGNFGDGGSFNWVNYSSGYHYPHHPFNGSPGTYYQTFGAYNRAGGGWDYAYTTTYK